MKEFTVLISTINDVKKFVNTVIKFEYDIDIVSGRYAIDAKSIMGLFSLDLSKELQMRVHSDDTEELEAALKEFIKK
jgi:phosphotransferase system HPr-like phosphotransfer protein